MFNLGKGRDCILSMERDSVEHGDNHHDLGIHNIRDIHTHHDAHHQNHCGMVSDTGKN